MGNTVDFEAWPGKIQQQTQMQSGRLQIVYALRGMRRVQCPAGFQFYDHRILNHQIGDVFPDHDTIVINRDALLLCNCKPSRISCAKAFSYTFSRKPDPSVFSTRKAQPMMRPDRSLVWISSACISVHLRQNFFSATRSALRPGARATMEPDR